VDVGEAESPAELVEPRAVRLRDTAEAIIEVAQGGCLVLACP
jgi:hypothetical protein